MTCVAGVETLTKRRLSDFRANVVVRARMTRKNSAAVLSDFPCDITRIGNPRNDDLRQRIGPFTAAVNRKTCKACEQAVGNSTLRRGPE